MEIKVEMAMEEMVDMGGLGIRHIHGSRRKEKLLGNVRMEEIGVTALVAGSKSQLLDVDYR